jgi:hypothetical protein
MVQLNVDQQNIYACLPFVELAHESTLQMGPVSFWPASKYQEFLEIDSHELFLHYMQSISQIKARIQSDQSQLVNTVTLNPQGTTCISIASNVPQHLRDTMIIDAIYLLYFTCAFRNLYYGNEILSFEVFRKMIPASLEFIQERANWEGVHIEEINREKTVCIHLFDQEIYTGLGKALAVIYQNNTTLDQEIVDEYRRLIRSIRYLVDRFFQRFVNLFGKGLNFSEELFEPEDVIFLSSSFESLFNINDKEPAADFKHKLRPLLHLKYSRPVEIFWKWVDDFYELKRKIVHQGTSPDPIFRSNPNFEIPHVMLGIKLFIYSVYYKLFQFKLVTPIHFDTYTPPDFKWIHPEEILLFFWTESSVIKTLNLFIKRAQESQVEQQLLAEISLLSDLFLSIYERYYLHPLSTQINFKPSPLEKIKENAQQIISMIEFEQTNHPHGRLLFAIPNDLIIALQDRIKT